MNMDPLNYHSFYATCTDIFLRRISVYWMIGPFQLSRSGYAPEGHNGLNPNPHHKIGITINALSEQNNKMAAEIERLKSTIDELSGDNANIKCVLDIKQNECRSRQR